MKNADVLIASKDGVYSIKVNGRATFECAPPLRNLAKNLETTLFSKIEVDLSACTGMDSTFMGILAMLGLRTKKIEAEMTIFNVSESNMALLHGLGLKKLFNFASGSMTTGSSEPHVSDSVDKKLSATTVLEAHEALMGVDSQNVKKFEKVVDLVQKDLDRMNADKNGSH